MRAKGIEQVPDDKLSAKVVRPKRAARLGLLVALALLIGAVVWFVRPRPAVELAAAGPAPLDLDALKQTLAREQVQAGGLERLLIADDAIERFAAQSAAGKQGARPRAEAILRAIRARATALAFVPWSLGEPRPTPVQTAAQTLSTLQKDGARTELYPLELTALAVSALRTLEVPAMVAELTELKGRKAPLDPSGYIGYFVVAVYPEQLHVGTPALYDVYAGQSLKEGAAHVVLSDTAALGAALALRALHENTYLADPKRALESTSHALRLAGSLPSVRTVRGVVVLTEKMVEQGLQEFQAARELRPDAARLHNVASVMLLTGEGDKAQSVLSAALEKAPDFAGAHATLGTLWLMQGQTEQGEAELQKAEQLAPDLSLVQWGMADLMMRRGRRDEALERAQRALQQRPSYDAKLRMAALLRQASKYDEMRVLAAQMLEQTPSYRRDEMRSVLTSVLGPTALEPEQPGSVDPGAEDLSDLGGPDLKLELPDSKLSGGTGPGVLNSGGNAQKLRLDDPSRKLHLDLGAK